MKTLTLLMSLVAATWQAQAATLYVSLTSTNPLPSFSTWNTAASNIQDAVDVANPGDLILVSNGVYRTGGRAVFGVMTNRVAVTKALTVRSVNGPEATILLGHQSPGTTNGPDALRCVYLTNGAVLEGFTLTNGATQAFGDYEKQQSGGAVWCESVSSIVSNCVLTGNSALYYGGGACQGTLKYCAFIGNSAQSGGGAWGSTLCNSTLISNRAEWDGGGSYGGTLTNCVLADNSAGDGGGAAESTLSNCSLSGNSARGGGGGAYTSFLESCTMTNNSAAEGGGVGSCTLSNCFVSGNVAPDGGGAGFSILSNCILSGNSAYGYGGGADESFLTDCVVSNNSAWQGGGTSMSSLSNCILSSNSALDSGGGDQNSTLTTCWLMGNSAAYYGGGTHESFLFNCTLRNNSAAWGGGTDSSVLNDCILSENVAAWNGGASSQSRLVNCTLSDNWATNAGGGAFSDTLTNCIVYYNSAPSGPNYDSTSTLIWCCSMPMAMGTGNFTSAPLLVDVVAGNLHLQSNSPCINAGRNRHVTTSTDLDGNPRIVGGTVDVGAYEFQSPASLISYVWLQQYGLPTDGSADCLDSDRDGMNNLQEWVAGTNPTNAASALRLSSSNAPSGMTIYWSSVTNRTYSVERASSLSAQPAFAPIRAGIPGQDGTTSYTDTNVVGAGPFFYRVGVQQ